MIFFLVMKKKIWAGGAQAEKLIAELQLNNGLGKMFQYWSLAQIIILIKNIYENQQQQHYNVFLYPEMCDSKLLNSTTQKL